MFEGALNRGPQERARFGTGAFLSAALHAAVLGGAILLSSGGPKPEAPEPKFVGPVLISEGPRRPASRPLRAAAAQRPAARPPRSRIVIATKAAPIQPLPDVAPAPAPPVEDGTEPIAGDRIGPPGDGTGSGTGTCEGEGCGGEEQVLVFTSDMTPPVRLGGAAPQYTRAAIEARVEGMTIVKCVIPRSGIPERCRIVKSLPYLDEAVLAAISTWRYRPATLDGTPVAVDYILRLQVQPPR